jgi:glutamate formiminotransferase
MEKDCQSIRQEALKISWFMRGGLTYDQAMALGIQERNIVNDLITDNLETTKKTGIPFF